MVPRHKLVETWLVEAWYGTYGTYILGEVIDLVIYIIGYTEMPPV